MRVLRYGLIGLAVLVLLVAAGIGGGFLWLNGTQGRQWLASTIEGAAASPDLRLRLGAIEGSLPFDFSIARLEVADSQGSWLILDRVRVALSPGALLARRVEIDALEAARIEVARAPVATQPAEPEPAADPSATLLPNLPVGLSLNRLAIAEIRLGAPLLGEAATLRVGGSARLAPGGRAAESHLTVDRIDERPGNAALDLSFDPRNNRLDLALKAAEPAGGMIARALALPGLPPVTLSLDGSGPLADWKGRLIAEAAGTGRVTADAAVQATAEGHAVTLQAGGDVARLIAGLAGEPVTGLIGPQPSLNATLVVKPDGGLSLRPVTLRAAAGSATLSGEVAGDRKRLSLRWEIAAGPDSALHALTAGIGWRDGTVGGTAEGPLDALALTVTAAVREVAAGDPTLAPVTGPEVRLETRATLDTGRGDLKIAALTLAAAGAALETRGSVGGWGATLDLTASANAPDLSRLSALAGRPLGGSLALAGPIRRGADGALSASLSGEALKLVTGTPADAVLGERATVQATASMAPDGGLRLEPLTVAGRNGSLTASATLAGGQLEARSRLDLTALAPLGQSLGTPMEGSARLDATARGPLDRLSVEATAAGRDLTIAGRRLGTADLTASAAGLPAAPTGRLKAGTRLEGNPVSLEAVYALTAGTQLRLSDLSFAAAGNRVGGNAEIDLGRLLVNGRLEGSLPELKALSQLAGMPLDGTAGFTLSLDGRNGRQGATLAATASSLRIEGDTGPLLAARRLSVTAEVADALGTPGGKVQMTLNDGSAAGNPLSSVTASLEGTLARAGFQIVASGAGADPLGLDLAGMLAAEGGTTRVRLDKLQGRYAGESFRAAGPATIALGDRRTTVSDLRISSGTARLSADLDLNGERLKGDIRIDQLPLALAKLASPGLALDGTLNAQASLGGTLRNPQAEATLRVAGLRAQQTTRAGVPGIDATVSADWRNRRLSVKGDAATRNDSGRLALTAAVPLVLDPDTMAVSLPPKGALEAAVTGSLDASLANDLLAASGDRARGTLKLDVKASGTVGDPRLGGTVTLTGGRYENRASGAVIGEIEARLVGDGDVFTLQSFRGRTRNGGAISGRGVIRPTAAGDRQLDLAFQADNARLVENDLLTAEIGADLTLTGGFTNARLAGPLRIRRAEVQLPDRLPANVVDLKVEEVGTGRKRNSRTGKPVGPAGAAPARQTEAKPVEAAPSPFVLALDMSVEAANQIFVRGRGLQAELAGRLKIGGTAAAPEVTGRFSMLKGQLDLLARTFTFKRGNLDFDGTQPVDPRLDLLAEATANGITAQVQIGGTARQPKLELTSPQGLPQDEVLSGVLFGKSVANLGAAEAVQLAQSAAALTGLGGSGGGLVDRVRRGLGIDRLDFAQGANGKGGAVQAGRYVGDGVYVGVEQGIGANQSRAKVEVDITRNLKAEAGVGANSETKFGLTFERDY